MTPLQQADFTYCVSEAGELEAKKAMPINAPRVRGGMLKISYLCPEGSLAQKNDVIVILESSEIETEYLNSAGRLSKKRFQRSTH